MRNRLYWRRWLADRMATLAAAMAAILVVAPLVAVFAYLLYKGASSMNWAFLTQAPRPVGESGGGMGNALAGSVVILIIASAIGVPLGIGAGIHLAEYGGARFGTIIRFTADVLNGVPSIVVGIAVYALVVVKQGHFSALSAGIALGIMMVPTVTRTTEEVLLMVPNSVREAALALGISRWRTIVSIVLRTATSGVITGVMLAFARVAGETAPLLFTAFGNQFWNWNVSQPTAALPLQIFGYAISPYDEWHRLAWAGALVLILFIVGTVALIRLIASRGLLKGTN